MDDPTEPEESPAGSGRGRPGGFPMFRAAALLVVFVVVAVVALGKVHGTATPSVAAPTTIATPTTHPHTSPTTTTTSTTRPPSSVPVLVANATDVSGAAADVSTELQALGWNMLPPVNASARVNSSYVYYVAGRESEADSVAATLHVPASAVQPYTTAAPISSIGTAQVAVVVGPDLAATASSTTTTT